MQSDTHSSALLPNPVSANMPENAHLHARAEQPLPFAHTVLEKLSTILGSPAYVAGSALCLLGWIVFNLAAPQFGRRPIEEPPFVWLQGVVALHALIISTTVLIRQNRIQTLAGHHARRALQVNPLAEEKSSKLIALIEHELEQAWQGH